MIPDRILNVPRRVSQVVRAIGRRRLDWAETGSDPVKDFKNGREVSAVPNSVSPAEAYTPPKAQSSSQSRTEPPRGPTSDPVRMQLMERIEDLRQDYRVGRTAETIHLSFN
jgi:hypothetical protein